MACLRKETFKNKYNNKKTESRRDHLKIQTTKSLFFVLFVLSSTPNKKKNLSFVLLSSFSCAINLKFAIAIVVVLLLSSSLFRNRFTHACMDNGNACYCLRMISTANSSCAVIFVFGSFVAPDIKTYNASTTTSSSSYSSFLVLVSSLFAHTTLFFRYFLFRLRCLFIDCVHGC